MTLTYVVIFLIAAVCFILGILISGEKKIATSSYILLGKNEEGNDRVIFNLGMEYDDIKDHDYIVFKVEKQ